MNENIAPRSRMKSKIRRSQSFRVVNDTTQSSLIKLYQAMMVLFSKNQ